MMNKKVFIVVLITIFWLGASVSSFAQSRYEQLKMEENKSLVRRWVEEGFNKKNFKIVDEMVADSFAVNKHVIGREGLKKAMNHWFTAFPDLRVTVDIIIAEGDKVGVWYTGNGTQKGEFVGVPPTEKPAKWFGFDLLRVQDGKLAEGWFVADRLGLVQQLGATLSPPSK